MRYKRSRLQKVEERKTFRQGIFFLFLTLVLVVIVFLVGIPLVIRLAVFLGNIRSGGQPNNIGQEIPISQPRLSPLPEATNSANLTINGYAPAGASVKIFINNKLFKEVTTDKDGEFIVRRITLKDGNNYIKAVSVINEKESDAYTTKVIYKLEPPNLDIFSPQDNDSFFDKDKEISVEGATDPGAIVHVNNHLAIVDSSGNFSLRMRLNDGTNDIRIVSRDKAGNENKKELKVNYTP